MSHRAATPKLKVLNIDIKTPIGPVHLNIPKLNSAPCPPNPLLFPRLRKMPNIYSATTFRELAAILNVSTSVVLHPKHLN